MLTSPMQNQAQQIPINTGNNINQIRTDSIQNPQIVRNQVASPDNERVHYKITFLPSVIMVKTYKPFKMFCPYCAVNITTVPEPKFNCGILWFSYLYWNTIIYTFFMVYSR